MRRSLSAPPPRSATVVLTERDLDLLTFVGLVGYASQDQLAGEFFTSRDRCRRRTRQLVDVGYLRITLVDSRAPYLLSLTSSGLRVLEAERPEVAERVRVP